MKLKTISDLILKVTGSRFLPVFTESEPKVERNNKKEWQISKVTDIFSKNI